MPEDEGLNKINLNMNFCGLDLSKIPQQNLNDWTVYIIPALYIISTFISMKITTSMQKKSKKNDGVIDITEKDEKDSKEEEKNEMEDMMEQSNKMMSWMMPIMSVSISLVAPLGLALYWFVGLVLCADGAALHAAAVGDKEQVVLDRKSTRLNSSHRT